MANAITNNPGIVTLMGRALLECAPAVTRLQDFAVDFSNDEIAPGSTIKIGIHSATSAAAYDASSNNYATGKETLSFIPVTLTHYVSSERFSDSDLLSVPLAVFDQAGKACGKSISLAINDDFNAMFTATGMTGTALTVPHDGTLTPADIAGIATAADTDSARAVLVLNPSYFGKALAAFNSSVYGSTDPIRGGRIPGAYGFKSIIKADLPSGIIGCIVPDEAVAVVSRTVPVYGKNSYAEVQQMTDPATGMTLTMRRFCETATGTNCVAVETAFGCALAQGAKIQKITVA